MVSCYEFMHQSPPLTPVGSHSIGILCLLAAERWDDIGRPVRDIPL